MTQIPSKAEILDWITAHPTLTAKREIAKAFGIKGAARIELKRVLKELEDEGHLSKRKKTYRERDNLPPVTLLQMMAPTSDGDLFARPIEWQGEGEEPIVLMTLSPSDPALGYGDRVLGKVQAVQGEQYQYVARIIRRIGEAPNRVLGVFRKTAEGGRIVPIDKSGKEWMVPEAGVHGAKDGELVEAQQFGGRARMGLPKAKIVDRLGDPSAPKAVSLIAIHQHGIPDNFPEDVINDADAQNPQAPKGAKIGAMCHWSPLTPMMRATMTMPALPNLTPTPITKAVILSPLRLLTLPIT